MQKIVDSLSGMKTYLTVAAGGVLLLAEWQGWLKVDPKVYEALVGAALVFIRLGVAKATPPNTTVNPPVVPPTPKP